MSVTSRRKDKEPKFFLYTKVSQNETKKLRKATTNTQARALLREILCKARGVSKIQDLLADFHYNNFTFAKEQDYTNEQISTVLAIFDYVLHYSLKNKLSDEGAFKIFSGIIERHSLQCPPHSLAIFNAKEVKILNNYALRSFFRHYSFYEFIFRPRLELSMYAQISAPILMPTTAEINEMEEVNPKDIEELADYIPNEQVLSEKQVKQEDEPPVEEAPPETKLESLLRTEMSKIEQLMGKKLSAMQEKIGEGAKK